MALASPEAPAAALSDWRLAIPEERRRPLRIWLWSIAGVTLAALIIGGITRLTHSGLSIVDWDPLIGVIPPLTDAQWQETFDRYREFPEYQKLRQGMSLSEFRFIFMWEYVHRLIARGIGVVFLIPFLFFAARGWLTRPLALRSLALFGLGAAQGLMGWAMVASGLVDRPSVSHYRLAAHLSLAFLIFGGAVWLARDLAVSRERTEAEPATRRLLLRGLGVVGVLLALQIVWGAFVAGLRAGFFFNTFPLMAGRLLPPGGLSLEPALRNIVVNPIMVQWLHRLIGTVLALAAVVLFWKLARAHADAASRRYGATLTALLLLQYLLGVLTLIYVVPVALGVTHQAMAMVIFGVWIAWLHHARGLRAAPS